MTDPRYSASIEARTFPGGHPPVRVNVTVFGLGAIHVYTGLGVVNSLDGIKADALHQIGLACVEAARIMDADTLDITSGSDEQQRLAA